MDGSGGGSRHGGGVSCHNGGVSRGGVSRGGVSRGGVTRGGATRGGVTRGGATSSGSRHGGGGVSRGDGAIRIHGGSGNHGGGVGTRGGKVVSGRDDDSGSRGNFIREHYSHSGADATLERHDSHESISKAKSRKVVEKEAIYTCGRYTVVRGGKSGGVSGSHSHVLHSDERADLGGIIRNTIGLQDVNDDESGYIYSEDDGIDQDNVSGNDVGEKGGFEDDASNRDDGGARPWIRRVGRKYISISNI